MSLFRETLNALQWVQRAVCALLVLTPVAMPVFVMATLLGRIFGLLAFFLPLKVILLAGSDGVPRYFAFFIDPADKFPWIVGLSVGAVVFYLLSLLLDALSDRVAARGSAKVIAASSGISQTTDQRVESKEYYSDFGSICGSSVFFVVGMSALGFIDPALVIVIGSLLMLQYGLSAALLEFGSVLDPNPLLRLMVDRTQFYLTIFYSINFLTGFFVLLIPYLQGSQGNILFAILAILIIRQSLKGAVQVTSKIAQLYQFKTHVDPFIFRQEKIGQRDRVVSRTFRQVFQRQAREQHVGERLISLGYKPRDLHTFYIDFGIRNSYAFKVEFFDSGSKDHVLLQQQIFSEKSVSRLDHEELLFEHVARETVLAPRLVDRFLQSGFKVQMVDFGLGALPEDTDWSEVCETLTRHLWEVRPPESLVNVFSTSRFTLEGRLTSGFLERLTVALDSDDAIATYQTFQAYLGVIKDVLKQVPLCIHNPAVSPQFVSRFGDDEWRIMIWHQWSIEHIGVGAPGFLQGERLESILAAVRRARGLKEDELTVDHVELARACRILEIEIERDKYNSALAVARRIVDNPLVSGRAQAA
ncbi:hypothetical protein [Wenzhouxiangella sp. EGI_FJ10305]|uniref:hypothetical protein n=1 Tax=Wenzhouxiangella sp. EGI_FJ10305 TaxID=3243768 RepID=UPI0035DE2701